MQVLMVAHHACKHPGIGRMTFFFCSLSCFQLAYCQTPSATQMCAISLQAPSTFGGLVSGSKPKTRDRHSSCLGHDTSQKHPTSLPLRGVPADIGGAQDLVEHLERELAVRRFGSAQRSLTGGGVQSRLVGQRMDRP